MIDALFGRTADASRLTSPRCAIGARLNKTRINGTRCRKFI